jgi:cold shock CspA family protein
MPKGYGFIKFQNGEDAKIAKEYLNHRVIDGQEISIEYSSDSNRKKPRQMALINSRSRCFQCYSVILVFLIPLHSSPWRQLLEVEPYLDFHCCSCPIFRMLLLHMCLSWSLIELGTRPGT